MANVAARQQIGTALRALAEDLVTERRRVLMLRRENRELREQLESIRSRADRGMASTQRGDLASASVDRDGHVLCPYCNRPLSGAARELTQRDRSLRPVTQSGW
jgi:DNA repair exonuclease SbcCD ATPase subunit